MAIGGIQSKFMAYEAIHDNEDSGATKTINWKNGNIQKLTLTDDYTLTLTNPLIGVHALMIAIEELDYTIFWPEDVLWASDLPDYKHESIVLVELYYTGTGYLARFDQFLL